MPASKSWREEHHEDMKRYRREWYARNKKHAKGKIKSRRRELSKWLSEYKSVLKCSDCSMNHPAVLQFHHLDPKEKDFEVGLATRNGYSKERILKEIDKCAVLCANCHAIRHFNERISH